MSDLRVSWLDCPVIEQVPGKLSGVPVVRGSRVRPRDLLDNLDQTPEWMAESFGLDVTDVRAILTFYAEHDTDLADFA